MPGKFAQDTLSEIQTQLVWPAAQLRTDTIAIVANHDLLLDFDSSIIHPGGQSDASGVGRHMENEVDQEHIGRSKIPVRIQSSLNSRDPLY